MKCIQCGSELISDEIGLSRKLINRGMKEFYCLGCLSRRFSVSIGQLEEMIVNFRASGCTLFSMAAPPAVKLPPADETGNPSFR